MRRREATVLLWGGLFAGLLATNRWTGNASIHPWAHDFASYRRIAEAAPSLPHGTIGSAFTQRMVPHYLVGLLNDAGGLGLHASYRIAALFCIAATFVVAERIFATLKTSWWIYAVGLTAFVLNPYSLRDVILSPWSFQDMVLVLGVGLMLLGLLRVRFGLVLAGAVVAILGRQTALLVGVAAAVWMFWAPDWKEQPVRRRAAEAFSVILAIGGLFAVVNEVASSFTHHFAPDSPSDTIFFGFPGVHELIAHFARCLVPLMVPGVALVTVLVILASAGLRPRDLPARLWLCLLLGTAIIVQPLLINPDFPGFAFNEQRLAALGLLPVCVALAMALMEAEQRRLIAPSPALVGAGLGVLFITSLHHVFSIVGPSDVHQFVALQILGAIAFAGGLIYARNPRLEGSPSTA